jgi:diguanylate cyclase (GGDEF)-like protein
MKLPAKSIVFLNKVGLFLSVALLLCLWFSAGNPPAMPGRAGGAQQGLLIAVLLVICAAVIGIFIVFWRHHRLISQRIGELNQYLQQLFQGKGSQPGLDQYQDELTEVREAFGKIYAQMEQSRLQLEENYRKLQLSTMQVEEKYAQAYTLRLIQEEISRELDTDNLLKKTVDIVIGVLGCKYCSIYLADTKEEVLSQRAVSGSLGDQSLPEMVPIESNHLLARVFREKLAFTQLNLPDEDIRKEYQSFAAVPLVGSRSCLGVLLFEQEIGGGITEDLLDFSRLIAQELSLSVENASLYAQMKQMATHDNLTGIFNWVYLMNYLDELFSGNPELVSVIILDIDHFKIVNDRFGHLAGDRVLKELAGLLRSQLPGEVLARYGGEEFVIVLPGRSREEAWQLAEKVRALISEHCFMAMNGVRIAVTISAGLASYPADSDNYERLLYLADQALYEAKNSGRNQVCVARPAADCNEKLGFFDLGI